jgi:hypothetical protein
MALLIVLEKDRRASTGHTISLTELPYTQKELFQKAAKFLNVRRQLQKRASISCKSLLQGIEEINHRPVQVLDK